MENTTCVRRIFVEKKEPFAVEAEGLRKDLATELLLSSLERIRILNRYDVSGLSEEEFLSAIPVVFSEPPVDTYSLEEADTEGASYLLAIEALPGQYDQRADSAAQCVQIITCKEKPLVKTARVLVFYGEISEEQKVAIAKYLINPVESREARLAKPESLADILPLPNMVKTLTGFSRLSENELSQLRVELGLAMSDQDLLFTQKFFLEIGREPTITEIRVLDTYWSDHCRHTTFLTRLVDVSFSDSDSPISSHIRSVYDDYLAKREQIYGARLKDKPVCLMDLATMAMRALKENGQIPDLDESEEINACSIRVKLPVDGKEEDYIIMFKNETHNHPTEIEPFGGAATCLGGAIRDPLSGRSYVYQAMRVTGAGDPRTPLKDTLLGKLSQKKLVRTAAAGYSSYGNQIGLSTGQVDEIYHPGYVAKRMEIGAVIGAAPADAIRRECPKAGDIVILLGGRTGRDGIGGATGSSKAHDEKSVITCGSEVQKGNPPTERKIQRLFRNSDVTRMIIRCNDFGAGGVSVAIGELADGLIIDLDTVPKKYEGLDGTELAISESQERMAVVVHPEDCDAFLSYAAEENLEAVPVATVTDEPRLRMTWRGSTIVDLPRSFLSTNGAPSYASAHAVVSHSAPAFMDSFADGYTEGDFQSSVCGVLGSLAGCSRKGLSQRFDSTIGARTVLMPFGGRFQESPEEGMVSMIPTRSGETTKATVMTYGFDPYLSSESPYHGAYYAVLESLLKLSALGADPLTARLTFQEYFERMAGDEVWGKPVLALLGAYKAQLDFGTPSIGGKDSMSGSFNDLKVPPTLVSFAVATEDSSKIVSSTLSAANQSLYFIRIRRDENGLFSSEHAIRIMKAVAQISRRGQIRSCAVAKGNGILSRTAQMCMGNRLGFLFSDSLTEKDLFGRAYGTILLSVSDKNAVDKIEMVGGKLLGHTTSGEALSWRGHLITLADAREAFTKTLEPVFPVKADAGIIPHDIHITTALPQTDREKRRAIPAIAAPRVFIPVFPGTNCEYDSSLAFEKAGAEVDVFVLRNLSSSAIAESLREMSKRIHKANIVMLPGGFSGGDEPEGSGKFIAAAFRNPFVTDAVRELLFQRDGLMIGICNGFQALVKLGLLPYGDIKPLESDGPTLTFNRIGRHQSLYVETRFCTTNSPWLSNVNPEMTYVVPVSHGEGRFFARTGEIENLFAQDQVATQYVDNRGLPSMDTAYNPNGSVMAIEGILSPDGRVFGKMGHTERAGEWIAKNIPGDKDPGIFLSGVRYFQ